MASVVAPLMKKVVAAATRMLMMMVIVLMLQTVAAAVKMLRTMIVVLQMVEDLITEATALVLKTVVGALLNGLKAPVVVSQMKATLDRLLDYLGLTCCNQRPED